VTIHINDFYHGNRIARAAGVVLNYDGDVVISHSRNGELTGGMLYNNYTGSSINIHIAGFDPRWGDRDLVWVGFDYPFNQLGCTKVFGQVPASNKQALEFDLKLGFKIETVIRDVFPDGDLYVVSMSKDDCRWLNLKPRNIASRLPSIEA
jgi:RimJ/RimL family protein N-acetyltransferase